MKKQTLKAIMTLVLAGSLVAALTSCGGGGATKTVTVTSGGSGGAMANLVVYGDMVTSAGCLETSLGHRGELVVFRVRWWTPKPAKIWMTRS